MCNGNNEPNNSNGTRVLGVMFIKKGPNSRIAKRICRRVALVNAKQ
jgi:hypothetical protein